MSLSYCIVEKSCYMLNRLPGDGARGLLMGGFKEPTDKVELPGFVKKSGLSICEITFDGFLLHRFRRRGSGLSSKAVLL